jgi:hypothetical protein
MPLARELSAEQVAARGPSPTQTIFPFARPLRCRAGSETLFHSRASPLQETTMTTKTKAIRALNDELRKAPVRSS